MKGYSEYRECVQCEAKYIEDCPHVVVILGGKNQIPEDCWREDLIKLTAKPHNDEGTK